MTPVPPVTTATFPFKSSKAEAFTSPPRAKLRLPRQTSPWTISRGDAGQRRSRTGWTRSSFGLAENHGRGADNVFDGTAAAQVGTRFGQTLEEGTEGFGSRQTLNQFVPDVAGTEIGEDQHVGFSRDVRTRGLLFCHRIDQRGVGLKLTVDLEGRGPWP